MLQRLTAHLLIIGFAGALYFSLSGCGATLAGNPSDDKERDSNDKAAYAADIDALVNSETAEVKIQVVGIDVLDEKGQPIVLNPIYERTAGGGILHLNGAPDGKYQMTVTVTEGSNRSTHAFLLEVSGETVTITKLGSPP